MSEDIRVAVLPDGANLICEKIEEAQGEGVQAFILHKPHLIQIRQTQQGAGLSLVPWPMFGDETAETVVVDSSKILTVVKPEERVKEGYRVEILGGIPIVEKPTGLLLPD
tara:strand:- start:318 stop:647 length:330 start_codon:yes stop_codon:yes gene_type:complete